MNPLDILPADRQPVVEAALASLFPGEIVTALSPMTGGASGATVYRLDLADQTVVLRLDLPPAAHNDPARHYACNAIAADAGVAPALLHADPAAYFSISAFVEAQPAFGHLPQVAATLRRLHDAPLFPEIVPYLTGMESLLGHLDASLAVPDEAMNQARVLLAHVQAGYHAEAADLVSSHNDLNPGNVLFDGEQVLIIDWGAAFAADRYVDLAALQNFFAHDAATEAMVLEAYFGRPPTPIERARTQVMRQVNRLFYGAVLIATAATRAPGLKLTMQDLDTPSFTQVRGQLPPVTTPEGQAYMGRVFFSDAMRGAGDPAFAAALRALQP